VHVQTIVSESVKAPDRPRRTPDEIDAEIIAAIGKRPGVNQKEPVERLVMGADVVGYHLRKLVREDKIVRERKGRTRVYHPVKK